MKHRASYLYCSLAGTCTLILNILLLLLLLLLLKPAAQAQVGKTKLFINLFLNPTIPPVPRKIEKNTQGRNQRLTAP